jgi:hypothetical protein
MEERTDYLDQLPNEMLQLVLDNLEPNELARLSTLSHRLQENVNTFVNHLIESGDLTDLSNQPPPQGTDVPTVLRDWHNGTYYRPSLFVPLGPAEALAAYDPIFNMSSSNEMFTRYVRADVIGLLEDNYESELSPESLRGRANLETYIKALLNDGRLVDGNGQPLPANTPVDQAISRWRNGELTWRPPQ